MQKRPDHPQGWSGRFCTSQHAERLCLPAIIVAVSSPVSATLSPSVATTTILATTTIATAATVIAVAPVVIAVRARGTLGLETVIAIDRTVFTGKERDKGAATTR